MRVSLSLLLGLVICFGLYSVEVRANSSNGNESELVDAQEDSNVANSTTDQDDEKKIQELFYGIMKIASHLMKNVGKQFVGAAKKIRKLLSGYNK